MEASRPIPDLAPARDDSDAYREHERTVLAMLATRYADLDPDGRRELYHEAWASVLKRRQQGTPIDSLRSYLLGAADKAASKRVYGADARRRITFDPRSVQLRSVPDPSGSPDEEVVAADEARRLRLLIQELEPREAALLKLRVEGLEPAEIRERLGLSERQYRRQAERAARALTDEFAAFDRGEWARRKRSLLSACVMGIASERQQRRAAELIAEDPLCRAMMSELRRVAGHVAAALPMPAALAGAGQLDHAGWAGRVADSALAFREKLSAAGDRVPSGGSRPLRQRAAEALTDTKQHAMNAYVRTADPTPLAAARPGAAAAMLAGCLAASGGAYCAIEGVPQQVRAPFVAVDPPHRKRPAPARASQSPTPSSAAPRPAQVAPPPVTTPSPPSTATSSPATAPSQPAQTQQSPPPPTNQEFEPSASSSATQQSAGAATSGGSAQPESAPTPAAKPAPATGGSGEFSP